MAAGYLLVSVATPEASAPAVVNGASCLRAQGEGSLGRSLCTQSMTLAPLEDGALDVCHQTAWSGGPELSQAWFPMPTSLVIHGRGLRSDHPGSMAGVSRLAPVGRLSRRASALTRGREPESVTQAPYLPPLPPSSPRTMREGPVCTSTLSSRVFLSLKSTFEVP